MVATGASEAHGEVMRDQPAASRATSLASGRCDKSVLHVALARGYRPSSGSADLTGLHVEVAHHLELRAQDQQHGRLTPGVAR